MRQFYLSSLFLLAGTAPALAQKLKANQPPRIYQVGPVKSPLFDKAADTIKTKSGFNLAPGSEAKVVGVFSPRWLIVDREGFLYLTSRALLAAPGELPALPSGSGIPVDSTTHRITYQGVVSVPGATKEQLYGRALGWIAKTYNSAQAVIQLQDKESGQLVVKGLTKVHIRSYPGGVVNHTLTIYVKEGRYKYIVTDLTHEASGAQNIFSGGPLERTDGHINLLGSSEKVWLEIRQQAVQDVQDIIAKLQAAMTVQGAKDPSDF